MLVATAVMVALAAGLFALAYLRDPSLALAGVKGGGQILLQILPLLVAAMVVAGLAQVLMPREFIARWLGAESGYRGILIGSAAGGITPGGPYVAFPIVAAIWHSGASIGTLVAYVTGWSLWAVMRLPMEIGIVGPKVTLVRLASTLILPPIAGLIAQTFFGRFFR